MIFSIYMLCLVSEISSSASTDSVDSRTGVMKRRSHMQKSIKLIKRSETPILNHQNAAPNVPDTAHTLHNPYTYEINYSSYVIGNQERTFSQSSDTSDASMNFSSSKPTPLTISMPRFNAMPYRMPLTRARSYCLHSKNDDEMSIALPSDLYPALINKCGQKVVVIFEPIAGQRWRGASENLTVTFCDFFDSNGHTELKKSVLLNEKAWKAASGNSVIERFESWPVRWFFIDSAIHKQTTGAPDEQPVGENGISVEDLASRRETNDEVYSYTAPNSNSTLPRKDDISSNRTASSRSVQQIRQTQVKNESSSAPDLLHRRSFKKRSFQSRRSTHRSSPHQHLLSFLKGKITDDLDGAVDGLLSGGWATYFAQEGRQGACGHVHKDSDVIVALDYRRYGDLNQVSRYCDRKVEITRVSTGRTITATVADACPSCQNKNSLDLSEGAFQMLGSKEEGMVSIKWKFSD